MNYKFTISRFNRRRFIVAGVAFFGSLYFHRTIGSRVRKTEIHGLPDNFYVVNGWMLKREDLI